MKPQRKANRLPEYDYSKDNLYFITTNVKNWVRCFGEIIDEKMILNDYGKIAEEQWLWLATQYPYVVLHEFQIMPDHIHGIIEINSLAVGTGRDLSLQPIKIKSLSELMGAYKTTTSKKIHLMGYADFAWHRSFYDRIIRNEMEFERISEYIRNNPAAWEK